MSKRCYYETLSVSRTATDGEIKTSYRKLAMQWHPDRNRDDKSAETRFKEISEAYDVLKDGDKRAAYDRFGHAAFEQGNGASAHGFGADFVGRSDRVARIHASSSKPHGHRFGVVVAAVGSPTVTNAIIRAAAEFAAPDDQGFVEQSALFEVLD